MSVPDTNLAHGDSDADAALLRRYVETRSSQEFEQIVERYGPVVHAAAMRQCRNDLHAAYDVTQTVFMLLAKKASKINPRSPLSAWLVRASYFAALSQRRAERRRRHHETEAAMLRDQEEAVTMRNTADLNTGTTSASDLWSRISPLLDEVLAFLPTAAREVLSLHYLENKTYAEAGRRLGITEEAARKRAERGLSALRGALARRGVHTYDEALEAALQFAVPVPLSAALTKAVSSGVGAAHHHTLLLKGALKLMAWSKAKSAAVGAIAALVIGGGGIVVHRLIHSSESMRVIPLSDSAQVSAPPLPLGAGQAAPTPASSFKWVARGRVQTESGTPVVGARVLVSLKKGVDVLELNSDLEPGLQPPPADRQTTTDPAGSFELPLNAPPMGAVILARDGATAVDARELAGSGPLIVHPYSRVEGTVLLDHRPPRTRDEVLLSAGFGLEPKPGGVRFTMRALTDSRGHFAIEHVPASRYIMHIPNENGEITIAPGSSIQVNVDQASGAPLVGKLAGMKMPVWSMLVLTPPETRLPTTRPVGVFVPTSWQVNCQTTNDGAFRLDCIPAGTYRLTVNAMAVGQPLGFAERQVQIPTNEEGGAAAVDVGTLKLKTRGVH